MESSAHPYMPSLAGAYSKLKLAKEDLLDLKREIEALKQPQPDVVSLERHRKSGWLRAKLPKRTDDISAKVGAYAVALQSVLNQLIHALWQLDTGKPVPPKRGQFPICERPQDFRSRIKPDLEGLSVEHRALVETLQPYNRCHALRRLAELANQDKHRDINDITASGATWEISHHLRFLRDSSLDPKGDAQFKDFLPVNPTVYAKTSVLVQSHMTGDVVFRESGTPVIQLLEILYAEVAYIFAQFEPLFD